MYQQHQLSSAFPAMTEDAFQALKDSIGTIGVLNPITVFEGQVLDGWHRYQAATELAMPCPSVELEDWIDPKDFVKAQNKDRRHLTQGAWALIEVAMNEWRPQGRSKPAGPAGFSEQEMAASAGVGVRSIQQAKTVHRQAEPEVVKAVKSGEIGLEKAATIAKLPKSEQAAAIHKPAPKPAKAAAAPEPTPDQNAPEKYTELDAARDQISELQSALVVANMGDVDEEGRQQAAEFIANLQAEIKTLIASLAAAYLSRDTYMEENAQLKKQCQMQRREIDRLKTGK